jgi:hypothetical protein
MNRPGWEFGPPGFRKYLPFRLGSPELMRRFNSLVDPFCTTIMQLSRSGTSPRQQFSIKALPAGKRRVF